jgi:uncharacterized membrane protein required for colicin V production
MMEDLPAFSVIDVAAMVVALLCAAHGYRRGLSGALAQSAGAVAALILGLYAYQPFSAWLQIHTRLTERAAEVTAFLSTSIAVIVALLMLRSVLKRIMKIVIEQPFDKWAGLLAGTLRAIALVSIVFLAMNLWPHPYLNRKFGEESAIGRVALRLIPLLRERAAADGPPPKVPPVRHRRSRDG